MEETTGYNGFTPSVYAEELYRDAKVNAQRKQRLQRSLDNLAKEQQQNLKHQMKQRIFKAGIEYYEARAEYCYYLAESANFVAKTKHLKLCKVKPRHIRKEVFASYL